MPDNMKDTFHAMQTRTFKPLERVRDKRSGWTGTIARRGIGFDAWGVVWDNGSMMNMFGYELEHA